MLKKQKSYQIIGNNRYIVPYKTQIFSGIFSIYLINNIGGVLVKKSKKFSGIFLKSSFNILPHPLFIFEKINLFEIQGFKIFYFFLEVIDAKPCDPFYFHIGRGL